VRLLAQTARQAISVPPSALNDDPRINKTGGLALTWGAVVNRVVHVHLRVDAHLLQLVVDVTGAAVQGECVTAAHMTIHRIVSG